MRETGQAQQEHGWERLASVGPQGYENTVEWNAEFASLRICAGGRCVARPLVDWVALAWADQPAEGEGETDLLKRINADLEPGRQLLRDSDAFEAMYQRSGFVGTDKTTLRTGWMLACQYRDRASAAPASPSELEVLHATLTKTDEALGAEVLRRIKAENELEELRGRVARYENVARLTTMLLSGPMAFVSPDAFRNGVEHNGMDEGMIKTSDLLGELEEALAALRPSGQGGEEVEG